jgi:hypothetical protein
MYHYVEYDKHTGEITGYLKSSSKEMLPRPASPKHDRLEVTDPKHVEALRTAGPGVAQLSGKVEGGKIHFGKVTTRPILQIKSEKTELIGDGSDKTAIEVQAVDGNGKPVRSLDDEIRITTDRGKLSERGGRVKLVHGYAKIELVSVNETVRRVRVRAESVNGTAAPGEVVLEFV